jgi:hypothetical protein
MKTAKELAYKAYCDALKLAVYKVPGERSPLHEIDLGDVFNTFDIQPDELRERFESWWSEWYSREEHKDGFRHKHNVYIDNKRYIQAE